MNRRFLSKKWKAFPPLSNVKKFLGPRYGVEIHWTMHARAKMRYYGLSESRVRRIIHTPVRIEEGIAPKTIAMMQKAGSAKHPTELWAMIEETPRRRKIISAWRYPGITKPRSEILKSFIRERYEEYAAHGEQ